MLVLIRPGNLVRYQETHRGPLRRILFILNSEIYAGIEHGTDPDRIPVGEYPLQMATMDTARMRALWVPNTKMFIHAANYADQLEGCAAPGTIRHDGVGESGVAMERFIKVHGGFKEKREVPFRCLEMNPDAWKNLTVTADAWQSHLSTAD